MGERIGEQFGNYRLTRLLGKGGFAETYLGEHTYLKTFAAVKVLQAQLSPFDQETFFNEARTIAHLKHPNIIRVLDFGMQQEIPYLVMDYASGGTLRQRHHRGEPLPLTTILPYVMQIAAALYYAHNQKIIHRDVKPENMLLGEVDEVLLGDFGVATIVLTTLSSEARTVAGTIAYMAPEQIQGRPQPASDQYALGVVVYEWLSGAAPFQGTYSEVAAQHERKAPPRLCNRYATLPAEVEEVVLTALAKDPRQRFGSIRAFANALEQASHLPASSLLMPQMFSSPPQSLSAGDPQAYIPTERPTRYPLSSEPPPFREGRASSGLAEHDGSPATPVYSGPSSAMPPAAAPRLTPVIPVEHAQNALLASPDRTRPASSALITRVLLGIIAVLLVISIGLFYYAAVYRPGQSNAVSATGSQSPAIIYNQATAGPPTLTDPLSKADSYGWYDRSYSDNSGHFLASCSFSQGAYHAIAVPPEASYCRAGATNFSDLAYQVEMTVLHGHSGGLLFRSSGSGGGYYFRISIDGSGTYILNKIIVDQNGVYHTKSIVSGHSTAIKPGLNQPNSLTVIARGSNFYLYVNGQYVTRGSDTIYRSGEIGVYADSDASSVEAYFRNAEVWKL